MSPKNRALLRDYGTLFQGMCVGIWLALWMIQPENYGTLFPISFSLYGIGLALRRFFQDKPIEPSQTESL